MDWYEFDSIEKLRGYFARKAGGDDLVSEGSVRNYMVSIKEFVEHSNYVNPDDMLSSIDDNEMLKLLDSYIGWCNSKGNAPATQIDRF